VTHVTHSDLLTHLTRDPLTHCHLCYRPGVIFLLLIMGLSPEEAIRRVSLCVNLRSFKVIQCKLIEIGRLPIEIRGVYPGGGEQSPTFLKVGG